MLKIVLYATLVLGLVVAWRLLLWHRKNRLIWQDDRKREGAVLSVLFGFAPAALALLLLLLWGGTLEATGAAWVAAFLEFLTFIGKTLFFCWLFVWVRWTVPRFRYDQLMGLGWKILIPLGLLNLMVTALLIKIGLI
jgi:NADH-quinone oxidoreductase subunit H